MNTLSCVLSVLSIACLTASGSAYFAGQELNATGASINGPSALATDDHGHLFIIEMNENKVRRIDLKKGRIATVAGNGKKCCYKDGAKATEVSLDFLRSLAVDSQGNIFVGENDRVRKVDGFSGLISTVAGDGRSGRTLDGTSALSVHFWGIDGLAVDSSGDLFAADGLQSKVFKIDMKSGVVHSYAGSGKFGYAGDGGSAIDASFRFPNGIATDKAGNLIIADLENCRIRRVDRQTGVINAVAVTGGVEDNCSDSDKVDNSRPGAFPSDPVSDFAGNIYFVEGAMNIVLRIDANTSAISIFAGTGDSGFSGDHGLAIKAKLASPSGLTIDSDGDVFIAEYINNRVRRVDARTKVITTVAGNGLPRRADSTME
jgi:trimeric autotransporter adhesin